MCILISKIAFQKAKMTDIEKRVPPSNCRIYVDDVVCVCTGVETLQPSWIGGEFNSFLTIFRAKST